MKLTLQAREHGRTRGLPGERCRVAELPQLPQRLLARQDRAVDRILARAPRLGRLSRTTLTHLLQATAITLLLVFGVAVGSTAVWALAAVPMTVIVVAVLAPFEERRLGRPSPTRVPGDENDAAAFAVSRAAVDSPTIRITPGLRQPPPARRAHQPVSRA